MSKTQSKIGITVPSSFIGGNYGSFYSLLDQTVVSEDIAAMSYEVTDMSNIVSISNNLSAIPTRITPNKTGIYNIQFSSQFYKTGGGSDAYVSIWLRKNELDIPNTSTKLHFANNTIYDVAAWNFFVEVDNINDYFEIMWTQDDAIIIAHEDADIVVPYPAIPSVILTVNQIA